MLRTSPLRITLTFLCISTLFLLSSAAPANADLGPKPTMSFEFTFTKDIPSLLVMEGMLLECEEAACAQAKPLEAFGPQSFSCFGTTCHAVAYSFTEYHQLVLSFSDGVTRTSNTFTKNNFEAHYLVTVDQTSLFVEEGRGYPNPNLFFIVLVILNILLLTSAFVILLILIRKETQPRRWLIAALVISLGLAITGGVITLALPATILIELLLAAGYVLIRKRPWLTTLTLVSLANVITQFALWAALNTFHQTNALILTIGLEGIIWGVEALVFYLPQRKEIQFKEAALLSLTLNLVSFGIGLLLPL
ncbi:MAG: hypothetical protein RBT34_00710 [Anaerolineaceae bacterium]|jgi:hypothetical protein|nr:hypothetical protein [Anaerolineaceae bacterium]